MRTCSIIASNNSTHSISMIREIDRNHQVDTRNFTDKKGDVIQVTSTFLTPAELRATQK